MTFDLTLHIVERLLLAAVLGGLIGLEREFRRKPAGLRTNMFMCIGAALFTLLSNEVAARFGGDHVRIASQIIPGIGFIGAGAILRERGSVVGLTTAATIFVVASVGMAVGAGMYATAVFASLLILMALTFLGSLEARYGLKSKSMNFRWATSDAQLALQRVRPILDEMRIPMQDFQIRQVGSESILEFQADVSVPQQHEIISKLHAVGGRAEVVPVEDHRD